MNPEAPHDVIIKKMSLTRSGKLRIYLSTASTLPEVVRSFTPASPPFRMTSEFYNPLPSLPSRHRPSHVYTLFAPL
jgi:hypothetical protein